MRNFKWSHVEDNNDYYAYYKEEELGWLEHWKPWKKWVWNQNEGIIMSLGCLKEVIKKLEELSE